MASKHALFLLLALSGTSMACGGCSKKTDSKVTEGEHAAAKVLIPPVHFTNVTHKAGLRFKHTNGAFGKKLLPETMGSGCAFLDYDNDGRQDLLFVNSRAWPGYEQAGTAATLALYRNEGDGNFADVTADVGLDVSLNGMGVAVGDYDNDGLTDLFITAVGGSHLFRNGTDAAGKHWFKDVTRAAGDLAADWSWPHATRDFLAWSQPISFPTSAAFVDFDKDGRLDLFVCHYVQWSPAFDLAQGFTLKSGARAYGPPIPFDGADCRLYRNKGEEGFEDVTKKAGIEVRTERGKPAGKSLGVCVCDPDDDGWPDLVVANDTVRNFLFHNQRDGTFQEKGQSAGVAVADGTPRGAMGIDWGQYRPGQAGFLIGNFANESDSLYRQNIPGRLLFTDVAAAEGVAEPSRQRLVFGLFFFDYDLDGRLDFLTNNGHLEPEIQSVQPHQSYAQPPQLFWNTGAAVGFTLVGEDAAGADILRPLVGRGCAFGEIDGNGTPDVVLVENGGPARLLRNDGGTGHHWVRLVLEGDGKRCNKSALGAKILLGAGGVEQRREVQGSRGYLSGCELPVTFGLGKATKVDRVEIHWPGRDVPVQVLTDVALDQTHRIRQTER